jgi:hypothetical protein
MDEILTTNFYSICGAVLSACFVAYLAWRVGHKARLATAAATFRASINPDAFATFQGHALHAALIQTFPAHRAAAVEFRRYLRAVDRLRFANAWQAYHGGDEQHPDFVPYYVHDGGPQLLIRRLEGLRDAARQT